MLLLGLCLLSCNNQSSKQENLSNLEQQDTIEQITITDNYELLFQRLSRETYVQANDFAKTYPDEYKMTNAVLGLDMLTSSQDTLNLIIESWLDKYYAVKGISKKTNTIEEYHQRDSIINRFIIDVEQIDELQDILIYFHITSVYENATYRLQKQHLIELKNEFDEYGCFGAEYGKLLLTDSCSYEKLLNSKHPSAILREKWE